MDFSEGYIPILLDLVVYEKMFMRKSILLFSQFQFKRVTLHFITCLLRKRRGRDDIVKSCLERKSIFCRLSLAECLPNYVSGIVAAHKKEKEGSRQSQQKKEKE